MEATCGRNSYSQLLFPRHRYYCSAITAINTMDDINRRNKYSASVILGNIRVKLHLEPISHFLRTTPIVLRSTFAEGCNRSAIIAVV